MIQFRNTKIHEENRISDQKFHVKQANFQRRSIIQHANIFFYV